jgi:recombination protein RecT
MAENKQAEGPQEAHKKEAPHKDEKKPKTKMNETALDQVIARISQYAASGTMDFPPNYSPENAARAAYLHLLDMTVKNQSTNNKEVPVLDIVTQASTVKAIMRMITMGLNIMKRQGYFIAYGDQLEFDEGVWGMRAMAKRVDPTIVDINALTVYENDEFVYVINKAKKEVVKHVQELDNIDITKIKASYAIIEYEDGRTKTEIVSKRELDAAWAMNPYANSSKAHNNFKQRMAEKTAVKRLVSPIISDSDDSTLEIDREAKVSARTISANAHKTPLNAPELPNSSPKFTAPAEPEKQPANRTEDVSAEISTPQEDGPSF